MLSFVQERVLRLLMMALYGRWPRQPPFEEGYSLLLPVPADMPFLLRVALEGLRHLSMPNCKRIIVISDGAAPDDTLRQIISAQADDRVCFVPLSRIDKLLINLPRSDYSANHRYFTQILRGVLAAKTDVIYLHDADAFWLEDGGIETQYREFLERGMFTLGVSARIDPMFKERQYEIPGTWELMLAQSWARRRHQVDLKDGWYACPDGKWRWFDSLLFGQFVDYETGKVGVMQAPPKFVHFYGTIVEYRRWQRASERSPSTEDSLFTLLLLSILAELFPKASSGQRYTLLPRPPEMARGLRDATAPITYLADSAPKRFASFRRGMEDLCASPVFASEVSRIRELLLPFDEHFGVPARDLPA